MTYPAKVDGKINEPAAENVPQPLFGALVPQCRKNGKTLSFDAAQHARTSGF